MKIRNVLIIVLAMSLFAGCSDSRIEAQDMLRLNHIVPVEDFHSEEVKPLVWDEIVAEYGVVEDYEQHLDILSLTTDDFWNNTKTQVFYTYIPIMGMTFDGFAVYDESNTLVELIAGSGAKEVFNADLNGDGYYELIINYTRGAEVASRLVAVYDVKNDAYFELHNQDEAIDYIAHLDEEKNEISVYTKKTTANIDTEKFTGILELSDNGLNVK